MMKNHFENGFLKGGSKKESWGFSYNVPKKRQCSKVQLDIAKAVTNRTRRQSPEEQKVNRPFSLKAKK